MGMSPGGRRLDVVGLGLGWLLAIGVWALVLSLAFQALNDFAGRDVLVLFAIWLPTYLLVALPAMLVTAVFGVALGALGGGRRWNLAYGAASGAVFLACLNAVCAWTPAYKAISPRTAQLVPMGAVGLAVVLAAFVLLMLGLAWLVRARGRSAAGVALVTTGVLALAGGHGLDGWYGRPSRVDLRERVAPLLADATRCEAAPARGLVFLAIDGFTWTVAAPLMEEGRLPNLQRLLARSAYGNLETLLPSYSPIVWTTMATGLTEAEHRIHGFLRYSLPGMQQPIARGPRLNTFTWWGGSNSLLFVLAKTGLVRSEPLPSTRRQGLSLWEVAGANGRTVGVFDWMNTWPIVHSLPGYIYSRTGPPPGNAAPASVHRVLEQVATSPDPGRHPTLSDGEQRFEEALALLRTFRPEISFHFNKTVDILHDDWAENEGYLVLPLDRERPQLIPEIVAAYELTDRWIGRFVDETPPGYVLAIASDHGFEFNGTHHANAPPGVIVLSGGPFACGRVIPEADVYDVAPTLLSVLGLPGTEAMSGDVLDDAFAPSGAEVRLTRLEAYPEAWRPGRDEAAPGQEEDWGELLDRLKAMGYVN